ncbi:MAG: response regulator [Reyranellaceae bacterium]
MRSILLTEDEFLIRTVMVETFTQAGFNCIEAPTGAAAMKILESTQPLNAIVVDIGLPDISGDEVIAAAHRLRPGIPVVRCSGERGNPAAMPSVHFFDKPYLPVELCRFVTSLVDPKAA